MYPILALAEILTEGLVFYRRAATVYRVANAVEGVSDMIDSLTGDKLRYHTSVKGDDAYLWILGKNLMTSIYKAVDQTPPDDKQVINVPLNALIHNQFIMTSPDAKSMINSYLYALGAEWQKSDDQAFSKMFNLIDSVNDKFTVIDPMYIFFSQKLSVTKAEANIMDELGMNPQTFKELQKAFDNGNMALKWKQALTRTAQDGKPIYKVETAIGIMMDGAKSVLPLTATEIPFSTERLDKGFSLNAGYLYKTVPTFVHPETIARGKSITKEMADMMSNSVMEGKGFVRVEGGKWKQLDETKIEKRKVGSDKNAEEVPTFVENATATVTSNLAERVEGKLSAMARLNRIKKLVK